MEPRTAVVVEDEADIREVVAIVLSEAGFTVHTFENGTDAVAAVRKYQPGVVTLDWCLPDVDGLEVAHQVRQFSDAYILMLTARTKETDAVLALNCGADEYMRKPFHVHELRHRVEAPC